MGDWLFYAGERVNIAKSGCHPRKAGELEGLPGWVAWGVLSYSTTLFTSKGQMGHYDKNISKA